MALTTERLRELYEYSPEDGLFVRRAGPANRRPKVVQVRPDREGYLRLGIDYRSYLQHRLAWLYVNGAWPVDLIDHINGDRCDNRICNLRLADQSLNQLNRHRAHPINRTGLIGAHLLPSGRFAADIRVDGIQRRLGVFDTPELAHAAYMAAKAAAMAEKTA